MKNAIALATLVLWTASLFAGTGTACDPVACGSTPAAIPAAVQATRMGKPCAVGSSGGIKLDFVSAMAGVPKGTSLRPNAEVMVYGLRALDPDSREKPAGCVIGRRTLPPAFELNVTFTVEPGAPVDAKGDALKATGMIWDDMYVVGAKHRGLQLAFSIVGDRWTPRMSVGLGKTTCSASGPMRRVKPGEQLFLTLRYYGDGEVDWDFAGTRASKHLSASGSVAPGDYAAVVGDRVNSLHQPFRGYIRQLTVEPLERSSFTARTRGRAAFERGEEDAKLTVEIRNVSSVAASRLTVRCQQRDVAAETVRTQTFAVETLGADAVASVEVPVETRLRPGWQTLRVEIAAADGRKAVKDVRLGIGPVFADRLPVLMWQGGSVKDIADMGMTHKMVSFGLKKLRAEGADAGEGLARLDEALVGGVRFAEGGGVVYYAPGDSPTNYYRRTRAGQLMRGKPVPMEVSRPELVRRARAIAADNVAAFSGHPAYAGVLDCSEWREHGYPSFATDHLRYRAATGRDVPPEIDGTRNVFVPGQAAKRYPDGLVPEDDPILAFYRWFWSGGDGWPDYLSAGYDEYRRVMGRYGDGSARQKAHPFFSWWDPAARNPPRWGAGGDADVLSQWVYAYPEAMNVGGPAEDTFAMAEGRPGQKVFMMTQVITYRSQVAPKGEKVYPEPEWVKRRPNAMFPSIPPDSLQEATWTMLAKPVQGIMYHGWGCIRETGEPRGYVFTNPDTSAMMRHLMKDVVKPLGPVLKNLPREKSPVAVFESFTSIVMGMPFSWGYRSEAVTFLQRARLDPRVVFEETLERDGFDGIQVLFAPMCKYLTPSLVEKIRAFQKAGGVLIGDRLMLPALKPDIVIPVVAAGQAPAADHPEDVEAYEKAHKALVNTAMRAYTENEKAVSLKNAADLRARLQARYAPKIDSDSGEIVTYARRWGATDYAFAISDKRTFGDYVGPWGRTMEKGVPHSGTVTYADPSGEIRAVYELSRGGLRPFARTDSRIVVPVDYETNDGRLFVFLRERIRELKVGVGESVAPGGVITAEMQVLGESGRPIPALLPVEIRVCDAAGRELDGAGALAAADGVARIAVRTNVNDAPGPYRIVFKDRASGLTAERTVTRKQEN